VGTKLSGKVSLGVRGEKRLNTTGLEGLRKNKKALVMKAGSTVELRNWYHQSINQVPKSTPVCGAAFALKRSLLQQ
jgi:hypothetical protein